MRRDLPTGTVTFLFTDIEGSTQLLHELGPEAYAGALAEHRRLLREAFAAHGGVEVDTQGDAFFVAFPTATAAADAGAAGQHALADGPVRVRIGLHTGVPTVTAEGYVGVDVHRGARIAALAHGRQTLLSPATAELLDGAELVDLGLHRLKDFVGAIRIYQLGQAAFPPLRTPGSIELPTPATRFLGREHELFAAVSLVVGRDPRLLTILGPGGTGKTRFAIELARLLADEAEGGTVFVPLAPTRDAGLVAAAVAQALAASTPDAASIAAATRGKRTHVVLDNLEHLLPAVAADVAALLAGVPSIRLLVTSREALRIGGEEEYDLTPLDASEAAELFLTRARTVRPEIEHTPAVEELCRRLDRLPLAIELAAARSKLLSPDALLDRLGDRLDLLRGTRDADPRHATLRRTIAWSHDLLAPDEQTLFARLSVFAAGCTLESAVAVCDANLEVLESLLDKSLLRRRTGSLGEDRFWMLDTIREFAGERLAEDGEANTVARRHAERMLEIARSAHLSLETGVGVEPQRHEVVLAERDDVRAALDWAAAHDVELGLRLAIALENFWAQNPLEGIERMAALLDHAGPIADELRAPALRVHGGAIHRSGDWELGTRRYEESLAVYTELGDERGVAIMITRLAIHAAQVGDVSRARSLAERALALADELELPWLEAQALSALATAYRTEKNPVAAYELTEKSAKLAAESGFRWWESAELLELTELGLELGELDKAERAGREGVRLAVAIEDRLHVVWGLMLLAQLAREKDELELAGRIWGAIDAEKEAFVAPGLIPMLIEAAGPLLSETHPRFETGCRLGRSEGIEAALELALGPDQTVP